MPQGYKLPKNQEHKLKRGPCIHHAWYCLKSTPGCPDEFKNLGPCPAGDNCYWFHGPTLSLQLVKGRKTPRDKNGKFAPVVKYDTQHGAPAAKFDKPTRAEKKAAAAAQAAKDQKAEEKKQKNKEKADARKARKAAGLSDAPAVDASPDDVPPSAAAAAPAIKFCKQFRETGKCDGGQHCPGARFHIADPAQSSASGRVGDTPRPTGKR